MSPTFYQTDRDTIQGNKKIRYDTTPLEISPSTNVD